VPSLKPGKEGLAPLNIQHPVCFSVYHSWNRDHIPIPIHTLKFNKLISQLVITTTTSLLRFTAGIYGWGEQILERSI